MWECYAIAALLAVFLIMDAWMARELYRSVKSRNWPTTEGTLLKREWKYEGGDDAGYRIDLQYKYVVDGVSYLGDQAYLSDCFGAKWAVRRIWNDLEERIRNGHHVMVYYNPEKPSEAILIPGFTRSAALVLLIMFVGPMLLGGAALYFACGS